MKHSCCSAFKHAVLFLVICTCTFAHTSCMLYTLQDVNKEPGAEDNFKKIGEAYEVCTFCKRTVSEQILAQLLSVQHVKLPPLPWYRRTDTVGTYSGRMS